MLTVVDLFCGAGGLSCGFAAAKLPDAPTAGMHIIYGVDRDTDAIKTFRATHFPNMSHAQHQVVAPCDDIKDITAAGIRAAIGCDTRIDVLVGGPSCQGVSAAGLRNDGDQRNQMLSTFIDLVKTLNPRWFVMENVPGLTHANNRGLLYEIFKQLSEIPGYEVSGDVLLAADYGVAQLRYRLFIIGNCVGAPIRFPSPTYRAPLKNGQITLDDLPTYKTVQQAIGDLYDVPPVVVTEDESAVAAPMPVPNHVCISLSETNKQRISGISQGQDWRTMTIGLLPERYLATRASDQKGAYGRLSENWPAYTITNGTYNVTAGPFTHPKHNRALSVREAALLQSFPKDYVFNGGPVSQYRQIGNAVPPLLAQAVAEAILYCDRCGEDAFNWGRRGRLDLALLQDVQNKHKTFPTLTPRHVEPATNRRRTLTKSVVNRRSVTKSIESVWSSEPRPTPRDPESVEILRRLASQSKHYRAAKRAQAILSFIDNKDRKEIVVAARVAEASVKKWVDGFFAAGLEGWRAYHTSVEQMTSNAPHFRQPISRALERVRKTLREPSKSKRGRETTKKRLYMNGYLLNLINHFQAETVDSLTAKVERALGASVGTVYVGDLLAIADVVLDVNVSSRSYGRKQQLLDQLDDEQDGFSTPELKEVDTSIDSVLEAT